MSAIDLETAEVTETVTEIDGGADLNDQPPRFDSGKEPRPTSVSADAAQKASADALNELRPQLDSVDATIVDPASSDSVENHADLTEGNLSAEAAENEVVPTATDGNPEINPENVVPPVEPAKPRTAASAVEDLHPFLTGKKTTKEPGIEDNTELGLAKAFLLTQSDKSNLTVYDHLTEVVMRILQTRPPNAVDLFETISADTKRGHLLTNKKDGPLAFEGSQGKPELAATSEISEAQAKIFERSDDDNTDDTDGEVPDIVNLSKLWEWAGVSLGEEESFMLLLSVRRLVAEKPLKSVRLWGKILGTRSNYIVVEAEIRDGAEDEDEAAANEDSNTVDDPDADAEQEEEKPDANGEEAFVVPKRKVKTVVPLPKEERIGVNKFVYYVCNYAGGAWTRLPDAIPEKVQAARQIRKYFTGDLKRKIISYPPFIGTEALYLRCQIARISAATVVSPVGYYTFDPEEEVEEDQENSASRKVILNAEYEAAPNDELIDPANWVHHVPYLLPQGRVKWESPLPAGEEEDAAADDREDGSDAGSEFDDEKAREAESVRPETGPPLLSPLAGDAEHDGLACWVSRTCSTLSPSRFSPILLRCTRWPGASVISYKEKFASIYVGDGHKDQARFRTPSLAGLQREYGSGNGAPGDEQEVTEQFDPTVEEEAAFEEERRAREDEQQEDGGEGGDDGAGDEDDN